MKRIAATLCLILLLFSLFSCQKEPIARDIFAMDTLISIKLPADLADEGFQLAEKEIARIEKLFSVTNEKSEIYRLNHSTSAVTLSDETISLIWRAEEIKEMTDGAFHSGVYSLMSAWGFYTKDYRLPDEATLTQLVNTLSDPIIVRDKNTVFAPSGIDLGGIAKGYCGTALAEKLQSIGVRSAIISLGGNVQLIGAKEDGSPWTVGITDPHHPEGLLLSLELTDTAVVTSGDYQRYFDLNGKKYHHILDPKTGMPAESDLTSVTVITPDGALADGLSTGLFVEGSEKALAFAKMHPEISFVFVTEDRRVFMSSSLKPSVASVYADDCTVTYF